MNSLSNKVAIITGASSGIGYESAKLFAQEGASVVLASRGKEALQSVADEIKNLGGSAVALAGDVTQESYAKALVELAMDSYGSLDIAFNNAGTVGSPGNAFQDTTLEDWNHILATNLTSCFLGAKYQIKPMSEKGGGSIIFTSSFVGCNIGLPQMAAYSASKSGLTGLTKSLAAEFGAKGIRFNALLPGGTNTPMGQKFASTPESIEFVKSIHALKRMAEPREIAMSALYLASDASCFTTGTTMLVDGGASISKV